jgi:hypothetical protein
MSRPLFALTGLVLAASVSTPAQLEDRATVAERVQALSRSSAWTRVASIPMKFPTFHPQGMVKINDTIFITSVEVRTAPRRFPSPVDGYDRDTGSGVGHLFKADLAGNLLADLTLGDGSAYHPGGIDYDGTDIWVPVSEYRPDSRTVIYKVNPRAMTAIESFRFPDSIGAMVHNTDDRTLHGVSWGSRRFYRWTLGGNGRVTNAGSAPDTLRTLNPSHYVDYQDCKYVGRRRMLCTGLSDLRQTSTSPVFRLGGLDLVSLADGRPLHQVPVPLWTEGGLDMTHNPVWIEPSASGLRAYFMPDDDRSTLYIYDVAVPLARAGP